MRVLFLEFTTDFTSCSGGVPLCLCLREVWSAGGFFSEPLRLWMLSVCSLALPSRWTAVASTHSARLLVGEGCGGLRRGSWFSYSSLCLRQALHARVSGVTDNPASYSLPRWVSYPSPFGRQSLLCTSTAF